MALELHLINRVLILNVHIDYHSLLFNKNILLIYYPAARMYTILVYLVETPSLAGKLYITSLKYYLNHFISNFLHLLSSSASLQYGDTPYNTTVYRLKSKDIY